MRGLVVRHLGVEYKIPVMETDVILTSHMAVQREEFVIEGGDLLRPFVSSFQKMREGIELEMEISEFEESSEPISIEGSSPQVELAYAEMISERDFEWELMWKLRKFREIEAALKAKGLLTQL